MQSPQMEAAPINIPQSAVASLSMMRREKRTVALNSVIAAVFITIFKVIVGVTTGSLGIISEAAHSAFDLLAAIITLFSVRVSDKPADADHQYGHGKIENFSAFLETGLLVLTCIWIVWEAVRRMFFSHHSIEPSPAAFVVLFVSMAVDWERARIRRAGNRYFADLTLGLHRNVTFQRSEQVSTEATNAVRRVLPNADVVIHSVPREIGTENIFDRIRAVATRNNLNVHDVSVQDINGQLHVEQHLELDETLSLKAAHDAVTAIEQQIKHDIPEISSILTHIESEPATIETGDELTAGAEMLPRLRVIASAFPHVLDVHEVVVRRFNDRPYLSCQITIPA